MWPRFFERFFHQHAPTTPLFLYNTLGKSKQEFKLPTRAKTVRMYNCGPTVYDVQHIGNLSMFVFTDILRRTLEYNGFNVKQVVNITDVGHLTSDGDEGEDRMTKGLLREGKELTLENMRRMGELYANIFMEDLRKLNINTEHIIFPRASDYIQAQIAMIATLSEKGYAYLANDGVYFDTSRFPAYGELGGINLTMQSENVRATTKAGKHNSADFALWKLDSALGWNSPWGMGFPGWHIECSAMIRATLGEQIDIHTGGIEHIGVHHNNEIAQSETVTGKKPLARFWMHRAHVQLEGTKLAKSKGNIVYLSEIIEKGFHPLSLRYLFLGAHYRTPSNFTWDALASAEKAFLRLRLMADNYPAGGEAPPHYKKRIRARFNDDLDTPGALAVLWEMTKDSALSREQIRAGIIDADRVLGLNLACADEQAAAACVKQFGKKVALENLPKNVQAMLEERNIARGKKEWSQADLLRKDLENRGYTLEDSASETSVFQK